MSGFDVDRIEGPDLVLRAWTPDDVQEMVRLFDDPAIARRTPLPSPFTAAAVHERLAKA